MTMQPSSGLVTLAQAAELLDVHYMTAYRYVRTGRMHAEKAGGKWWVAPEDLQAVVAEGTGRRPVGAGEDKRLTLVEPLTARLVVGDTAGCWDLISDALTSGATPAQVHLELLSPALERIGEQWRNGQLSIADEHRATASAYRLIGQLGPLFRHRGRRRGTIIVGTVSGDMHAIPTAILTDLLCERRFEVVDLGANTPAESFVETARAVDNLAGIGVCAVTDESADVAMVTINAIRKELPEVFLVAGGSAFHRNGQSRFATRADVVSKSAIDACDAFERSLESVTLPEADGAGA